MFETEVFRHFCSANLLQLHMTTVFFLRKGFGIVRGTSRLSVVPSEKEVIIMLFSSRTVEFKFRNMNL